VVAGQGRAGQGRAVAVAVAALGLKQGDYLRLLETFGQMLILMLMLMRVGIV
jgi:hypothetical protein